MKNKHISTRMARLLCTVLTLILLTGATLALTLTCATASTAAEAQGLKIAANGVPLACWEYREAHPELDVELITVTREEDGSSNLQDILQAPNGWDVAFIWTNETDLEALDKAGLLMDMSGENVAAEQVAAMYPSIREAVTRQGHLLGVPTHLVGMAMRTYMGRERTTGATPEYVDIAERLGFTKADYPKTFDDLCAFAERYMALPKGQRKGTVFHIDAAASNAKHYFTEYLISLYTAEFCEPNGHVEYDTPAFRQALNSLDNMVAALKSQPKVTYGQDSTVYGLVYDAGSSLISDGSSLHLQIGDSTAIPARMELMVVNAHTPRKAAVMDFIAFALEHQYSESEILFLEGVAYEQLAIASYNETIEAQKAKGENQEVMDSLIQERDSGDYQRFYSREALADYQQNVVANLTFPRTPWIEADAIAKAYARGKLDADGLIAKLNAIADANVTE